MFDESFWSLVITKIKRCAESSELQFRKKEDIWLRCILHVYRKNGVRWLTLPCMQNDYLLDITRRSEEKKNIVSQDIMLYVTEIIKCKNFQFIKVNKWRLWCVVMSTDELGITRWFFSKDFSRKIIIPLHRAWRKRLGLA